MAGTFSVDAPSGKFGLNYPVMGKDCVYEADWEKIVVSLSQSVLQWYTTSLNINVFFKVILTLNLTKPMTTRHTRSKFQMHV